MRLKGSWSVCGGMEDVVYMNGGLEKIMENGEGEEGPKKISNGSHVLKVRVIKDLVQYAFHFYGLFPFYKF